MDALDIGQPIELGEGRGLIDRVDAVGQSRHAACNVPNDDARCQRREVKQNQFDDASRSSTANASKKHHQHDEYSTDD